MKLDPIGRVENPQELDVEPITIPVVGYTTGRKEVCEEFNFHPSLPWGNTFDMFEAENGSGPKPGGVIKWLYNCLLDDDERERFRAFCKREDVIIAQQTMEDIFQSLAETYAARPTLPRSASTGGGASTKRTSQAASRASASRSKNSRQPSR